ncbi:siderophore biosynthesis protein [Colletotrichum higginsianum]|uniref:Siderophore biosynthesis protein n=1 Tax=Colletotrichum higginsianum TaxID=80884 RepID=A0A4T0VEW4_9PEZI|nr:hypothetical protein CH35J_012174 [Colletotrichum higginsianum]GJD03433.1 siderophore biosynthesis protein [Colletotrichum higginsianum]
MARYLLPVLAFTVAVLAKTDLEGCTSFTSTVTVNPSPGYGNTYETVIWYVPDTLEICAGVDCGGGRAPPRKVPGCPAYSGTETVTASFLPTNPAAIRPTATPTATPTAFTTALGETDADKDTATTSAAIVSKRTSTVIMIVTTTLSTGQASGTKHAIGSVDPTDGASRGNGTASATTRATVTSTITTTPAAGGSGSESGAAGASSTEVPAGAGPTARAGVAAIIGVAAAVAAFA